MKRSSLLALIAVIVIIAATLLFFFVQTRLSAYGLNVLPLKTKPAVYTNVTNETFVKYPTLKTALEQTNHTVSISYDEFTQLYDLLKNNDDNIMYQNKYYIVRFGST